MAGQSSARGTWRNPRTTVLGIEREREGNCFFAGEHTADQCAFLNSGIQSGMRAASEVIASLR